MKKGYYLCAKFLHDDRSAFIIKSLILDILKTQNSLR